MKTYTKHHHHTDKHQTIGKLIIENLIKRKVLLISLIVLIIALPLLYLTFKYQKPTHAASWAANMGSYEKRKQITLVNNSGATLHSTATYTVTIDTKALYDAGNLQLDCDDLRVLYQPNDTTSLELKRNLVYATGTTCATSTVTQLAFSLQADLSNSANSSSYYVYYKNTDATTYSSSDALDAYNIGAKEATFVAPFNGTTTAFAAGSGTPTTETGAIRYSGNKTALSFDGTGDKVQKTPTSLGTFTQITLEAWVYITKASTGSYQAIVGYVSGADGKFVLAQKSTSSVIFGVGNVNTATKIVTASLSYNTWTHFAGVYDGTNLKIFKNGALVESKSNPGISATIDECIGSNCSDNVYHVSGMLDEVRVSDTARYSTNFTVQTSPFVRDENTELLLHFDENGDDPRNTGKAIDDSGNNYHGTITGAKYVGGIVGIDGLQGVNVVEGYKLTQPYASHNGIFLEEGTTNKITNPSFENSTYSTNWSDGTSGAFYDYIQASTTFTAKMQKRNSAGPFNAGILSQGIYNAGTPTLRDNISWSSGSQVAGTLYTSADTRQGTIVFWITPEWNGNDNKNHYFFNYWSDFTLYKDSANRLQLYDWGGNTLTSISDWVAGNTYCVIFRWDQNNKINGTNYVSVSINDTTVYYRTTPLYIGGVIYSINNADAIIEGLTVYRRVLYDGQYGINVGNGDELTKIYNATNGKDPTLVTGSWDVALSVPTNATTGQISTGTGNAWSHPFSSNLLYTNTTNTGGFMMNGTYTADGFLDEGTPTGIAALTTTEKVFNGGYQWTNDSANEGIYRTVALTSGNNYVVRALAHSNGTSVPKIQITRADGSTEINQMTGTTTCNSRATPCEFLFTFKAPATENAYVKLLNTQSSGIVYWHYVEILNNSWEDPSFESGTAPTDVNTPTTSAQSTTQKHSGSNSWKIVSDASDEGIKRPITTTSGNFYSTGGWVYADTTGTVDLNFPNFQDGLTTNHISTTNDSWTRLAGVNRASAASSDQQWLSNASQTYYLDDVYSFGLNNISLTVTAATSANSTEPSGHRVDGLDTLTQSISNISGSSGNIRVVYTPRHSAADIAKFDVATPYVFHAYNNTNDYIALYWSAANTIKLEYSMNGSTGNGTWDATGAILAGTSYIITVNYTGGDTMILSVDGTARITLSSIPASFGTTPTTMYWGTKQDGTLQSDATFSNLVISSQNATLPYYQFGTKSAKLEAHANADYYTTINPGNTNTHTLSAYVYDLSAGNVGGTVSATVTKLLFNGVTVTPAAYTDMGGGWWRLTYSAVTANSLGNYGVSVLSGKTIYVDGVQLEEKAYATTYADGSFGTGYAWTGTTNDSTSTRTAALANYSTTANVSPTSGSISYWLKSSPATNIWTYPDVTGINRFTKIDFGSGDYFEIYTMAGTGYKALWLSRRENSVNQVSSAYTGMTNYAIEQWLHIVATWSGTTQTLFVNGVQRDQDTGGSGFTNDSGTIYLSSNSSSDAIMSEMRIFNTSISSTEVADLYYSGLGSHTEQIIDTEKFSDGEPPVLVWRLDEGYGTTAYDSTTYLNHGTLGVGSSAPSYSFDSPNAAKSSKSLKFDGSNDYISKTYSSDTELNPSIEPFSVSAWFKSPATVPAAQMTLISRFSGSGYKIYMNTSGYLCFGIDFDATWSPSDFACSTISYADSKWHHAEAVKGTTSIVLYVDGVQVGSDNSLSASTTLSGSNPTFYVGIDSNGSSYPWNGFIDNIRIYNSARSTDQIKQEVTDKSSGSVKGVVGRLGGEGPSENINQGLVGYWKMDEASWNGTAGEVIDASGNGNNGVATCTGTGCTKPTTGAGNFGNGGSFDGSEDYVSIANSTSLNPQTLSVSMWVKGSTQGGYKYLLVKQSANFAFYTGANAGLYFYITPSGYSLTLSPAYSASIWNNQWHHVVGVYDGSKVRLYVDGTEFQNGTICGGSQLASSSGPLYIGGYIDQGYGGTLNFNGTLDEVRIYNRALSPAEIRALYDFAPGPAAYWNFEEGTGLSANDISGNANTGTLGIGSSAPTWTNGKYGKGLSFDGGNDYVSLAETSYLPTLADGSFSINAWAKITNKVTTHNIVRRDNYTNQGGENRRVVSLSTLLTSGYANFGFYNGTSYSAVGTVNRADGNWHHFVGVYDAVGKNIYLYVDGVLEASNLNVTPTLSFNTVREPWVIGSVNTKGSAGEDMLGSIDDIRIYNYARTQKQIVSDMNAGHPAVGSPIGSAVAYYKFDEGRDNACSGGVNDVCNSRSGGYTLDCSQSGMSVPATATSGWTNSGKFGKAMNFDGSDDFLSCGDADGEVASEITVTLWVNPRSGYGAGTNTGIISKRSGSWGGIWVESSTGKLWGRIYQSNSAQVNLPKNTVLPINTWSYIVLVASTSDNKVREYINGREVGSATYDGTILNGSDSLIVGSQGGELFGGSVDEVKIYNYALTEDEVKLDYNRGSAMVLGALGNNASYEKQAGNQEYCVPGGADSCLPPVAEWKFDEKNGLSANDSSGNGHTGTLGVGSSAPTWTNGKISGALSFDGSSQYATSTDTNFPSGNSARTAETWFKTSANLITNDWDIIFAYGTGTNGQTFSFGVSSSSDADCPVSNSLSVSQYGDALCGTTAVNDGKWHHATVVYNGSNYLLYVDGKLQKSGAMTTNTINTGTSYIGRFNTGGLFFTGSIDQVRFFNYARSPAQIAWDYNKGAPIGWWKMNECQGVVANDSSVNGNAGTITIGATGSQSAVGTCATVDTAWGNGVSGKYNASLNFDGTDDWVDLGTGLDQNGEMTISAWINTNTITHPTYAHEIIANCNSGGAESDYILEINRTAGRVSGGWGNTIVATGNTALTTGTWHHAVMVRSGSTSNWTAKLYLNGKLDNSGITAVNPNATNELTAIGRLGNAGIPSLYFNGQIDDVKIFNYALTETQIKTMYNENSAIRFGPATGSP